MTITAETFVDAVTQLCGAAAVLGIGAAVELHRTSGLTGLAIDNFAEATDALRQWTLTEEYWRVNPLKIELRRQIAILGPEVFDLPALNALARDNGFVGADQRPVGVPLLGPSGWFGTVVYSSHTAPCAGVERQLAVLATELSVWCTARGISTLPEARPLAPRQHDVAQLAASGRTNWEIAQTLGISINTVKLRLKQAFERLGIESRTELVTMFLRLAPLEGIPPGISRRGTLTITRGP